MKKIKLLIIFIFILISFLIFSEIIILKNGNELKGKIIKTDEDTMTILTKTNEIVIDKNEIANIYYDEKKYEEDKNKTTNIPEKKEIIGPHIISSVPENGADNILYSKSKIIIIKFNEGMDTSLSYESSEEINKPKWIDSQTLQIELKEFLDYGKTFKLVLNPLGKQQIMKTKSKILLPPDTIFSFTTEEAQWKTIYTENFNKTNTENGNIGPNWEVNNFKGAAIVKIENNELAMCRKKQGRGTETIPYVKMSNDILLNNDVNAIKIKAKFKNDFFAITLIGNNESCGFQIYNNNLLLNHYTKKYVKEINCIISKDKYYLAELTRNKNLLSCEVKNEDNTFIKKISIDILDNVIPSSIKLLIVAGGNIAPFVYIDDLEISVY